MDSYETATSVFLFVPNSSEPPREIVTLFSRGGQPEQFTGLKLKWADGNHLDVSYTAGRLSMQTVLLGDVNITLHGPEAIQMQAPPPYPNLNQAPPSGPKQ